MKKIIGIIVMALLAFSLFAGGTKEAAAETSVARDNLVIAVSTEPTTLHPATTNVVYDELVLKMLYGTLMRYDEDMNVVPYLAEKFEKIDDTHYKFTLYADMKFSDGTPITSADCAASIQAIHDSKVAKSKASWYQETEIIDDRTFVVVLNAPTANFMDGLISKCYIAPKALLEGDNDFNSNPVGSGPYMLESWSQGQSLTLVANPYFAVPDRVAKIKTINYRIIPEGVTRTISLEKGEVDFIYDVQSSDLEELSAEKSVYVYSAPNCTPVTLCFNLDKMPNENLRKAIAAAINRDNIVTIACGGYASPVASSYALGVLGGTDAEAITYDVEKAKEYLKASGLSGNDLKLDVVVKETAHQLAMESAQADLKAIGIDLSIRVVDNATYTSLIQSGDYYMMVGKASIYDLVTSMSSGILSNGSYNQGHIKDAWIDEMVAKAATTMDDPARAAILEEIVTYLNKNCLRSGLYQMMNVRAMSANLGGFETNMLGYDFFNMLYWK